MNTKLIVLCVDDEQTILQSLKSQLKDSLGSNYALEVADAGSQAMEIINEALDQGKEIPLVVVDYLMPGMRGDELLINIRKRSPETLCIMLTGQADLSAVANAINNEALFRFLAKPWNKEDLLKTMEEAFRRRELEKNIKIKQQQLEAQNIQLKDLNSQLIEKADTFFKFVPKEFLKILNLDVNKGHLPLGESCEKQVCIVFTDIRGFTNASQLMTTQDTFHFINSFTGAISPIINKHNGFIDKFIGDAVLSIFFNVNDALNAAFDSIDAIQKIPESSCIHNIKLGFSVNYGNVQMGTVGYEGRMETTILGRVVNIAARIEKLNKKYNTQIILTEEATKAADSNQFSFSLIDENAAIEGINEPIKLYTALKR